MDSIAHTEKLFKNLDVEITAFIGALTHRNSECEKHLGLMVVTAKEIGGKMYQDIEQLKRDYHQFLIKKVSLKKIQEDAIRIKHEVRPL